MRANRIPAICATEAAFGTNVPSPRRFFSASMIDIEMRAFSNRFALASGHRIGDRDPANA